MALDLDTAQGFVRLALIAAGQKEPPDVATMDSYAQPLAAGQITLDATLVKILDDPQAQQRRAVWHGLIDNGLQAVATLKALLG